MVTGAGDEELRLWKIFDEKTTMVPYDLRWFDLHFEQGKDCFFDNQSYDKLTIYSLIISHKILTVFK
jgi:WD40 repeat protein